MDPTKLTSALRTSLVGAVLVGLMACGEGKGLAEGAARPEAPPAGGVTAFLAYQPGRPAPGDTVRITLRALTGSSDLRIGSFTAMLSYPTESLEFVDAEESTDHLIAAHPLGSSIRVAGASLNGFEGGRLVSLRFLARSTDPIAHLSLSLQELSSTKMTDLVERARVSDLVVADDSEE